MRGPDRNGLMETAAMVRKAILPTAALLLGLGVAGCQDRWEPVPGTENAVKSAAAFRARRVLYDGAPPTIPHQEFGVACTSCHDIQGLSVEGLGFAPPSPHEETAQESATLRCRQCHVYVNTNQVFVENSFVGLEQDLRPGGRLYPGAPPTIPHETLMRENCRACHDGAGVRAEIQTSHPERKRCRQCHVAVSTREEFVSGLEPLGSEGGEG